MIQRAFFEPHVDERTQLGWLLILELHFEREGQSRIFRKELIDERQKRLAELTA